MRLYFICFDNKQHYLENKMAIPRVFVSSTCYDLKYIRENIKYFVKTLGYEPVLSDDGDVFYDPSAHTHDACLREVESCQLFVLIIGGRYGGKFKDEEKSITNKEYEQAKRLGIPIFTLVESGVYSDHNVYNFNKRENKEAADKIKYPNIDNVKIFEFIDQVRRANKNNALNYFSDFSDIESYLKKQWAGMMYNFLDKNKHDQAEKVTHNLLERLNEASSKTEELLKRLFESQAGDEKLKQEIRKTISEVEQESLAKSFVDRVTSIFNIGILNCSVKDLLIILDEHENWTDFLLGTGEFVISDAFIDGDVMHYITCDPDFSNNVYSMKRRDNYNEIQKLYLALRTSNKLLKEKILSEFVFDDDNPY